ncbi:uncharacterized protein N7496_000491 [Penicillium cataractarum]|uniref:BTB domain-containing protein n=1 Tax=Penicillium cataractarum TaxID=2100454 RepID=A0A9W9VUB8_9EURO|nr:uncharacterized protein N7496_000491 [Penicillium cataractarum]KAJ5389423.1 hypothetical protein N7496_000491 [Penicillium cataractarum]
MDAILKNLHLSENYSDLTIICGDKEFNAHKLVVCSQSAYFQRACYGSFKDAHEPIRFPDKEPVLMEKFLEFLYNGDYTLQPQTSSEKKGSASKPPTTCITENPAYFHARMFAEDDYFLVDNLKARAEDYFFTAFSTSLEMKNRRKETLKQTVEEVYSNRASYDPLRESKIHLIMKMLCGCSAKQNPYLRDCMRSTPDFTFDVCRALLDKKMTSLSNSKIKNRYPFYRANKPVDRRSSFARRGEEQLTARAKRRIARSARKLQAARTMSTGEDNLEVM